MKNVTNCSKLELRLKPYLFYTAKHEGHNLLKTQVFLSKNFQVWSGDCSNVPNKIPAKSSNVSSTMKRLPKTWIYKNKPTSGILSEYEKAFKHLQIGDLFCPSNDMLGIYIYNHKYELEPINYKNSVGFIPAWPLELALSSGFTIEDVINNYNLDDLDVAVWFFAPLELTIQRYKQPGKKYTFFIDNHGGFGNVLILNKSFQNSSIEEAESIIITGCNGLYFNPTIYLQMIGKTDEDALKFLKERFQIYTGDECYEVIKKIPKAKVLKTPKVTLKVSSPKVSSPKASSPKASSKKSPKKKKVYTGKYSSCHISTNP